MIELHVLLFAAFVYGATVGSFLNVVIYRLPRGESVVTPRSRCPACSTPIPLWHNIPVLSWLLLGGRCASCRASVAPRYLVVEVLTGALWAACAARYGTHPATLMAVTLASALVVVTFVDIDIWEIPDEITLPGIALGSIARPLALDVPWWEGIAGAACGAASLWTIRWLFMRLRGVEGMGLGDVKLLGMLGAFLGPQALLPVVLVSSMSGAVVGSVLLAIRGKRQPRAPTPTPSPAEATEDEDDWVPPPNAVPFGPFLALGGLAELLVGPLGSYWLR